MKTHRQSRPKAEPLEGRALLSTLAHPHLSHPPRVASVVSAHPVTQTPPLQGSVAGDYVTMPTPGSAGSDVSLSGSGTIGSLGTVQLSGVIHNGVPGSGKPSLGNLVLANNQGTIQIALKRGGGRQPLMPVSASSYSTPFRYTIVGGTGAFRKFHVSGMVALVMTPNTPPTLPPTPIGGGSGSTSGGGPGAAGGSSTGTSSSNGAGTLLPPAPAPPVSNGGSDTTPGQMLPPTNAPPSGSGHAGSVIGSSGPPRSFSGGVHTTAVKASTALLPTFLRGRFTLTFNGGPSIMPPPL
jgi:hypothetical protein